MGDTKPTGRVYCIGCDLGGWHGMLKDALAVCRWDAGIQYPSQPTHGRLFYPLDDKTKLIVAIHRAKQETARVIIAVDAALAWPTDFLHLAIRANRATHIASCIATSPQIENTYLFRETDRFIKTFVRKDRDPYSAPGNRFGNNSSKAQSLVAFVKKMFQEVYRPPFDQWNLDRAKETWITLIEVYPAASMASEQFSALRWQEAEDRYADLDTSDENDAKRCSTTAACYGMTIGIIPEVQGYPKVWLPDDEIPPAYDPRRIRREGWIFAPKRDL